MLARSCESKDANHFSRRLLCVLEDVGRGLGGALRPFSLLLSGQAVGQQCPPLFETSEPIRPDRPYISTRIHSAPKAQNTGGALFISSLGLIKPCTLKDRFSMSHGQNSFQEVI